MKKMLFALVGIFMAAGFAQAQEDGSKLAKQAGRALATYNIDPTNNAAKLDEAKQKIDQALQLPDAQAMASAWITKGDIYNTLLQKDMAKRMIDPKAQLTGDNDALVAFEAYKKGYENPAAKKYEKSDAVKGILEMQGHLVNIGAAKFDAGEYEKAYNSFVAALQAHDILKANTQKSALDNPAQYGTQQYITGLAAQMAKRYQDAIPYLEALAAKDSSKVYEPLYQCKLSLKDTVGAEKVLQQGRAKFPDDTGLLFAEINSYLQKGKLDELTGRLKQAITKEPDNVSLYVTLGNVYDNLYQTMAKEKNTAKADEYFGEAKNYYTQATEKNPKNVDAVYSLGALYYNKAAVRTQELNSMPEDYSSAGLKKLQAYKDEVMSLFEQALPYFQKAESLDPNDLNTLIALNEIYARKEDELSIEFKKRLDTVRGNGKNSSPYFNASNISPIKLDSNTASGKVVIQMKKKGGVYEIPCKVNGLQLDFIFDTGASNVSISLTEAAFMLKNGYLKPEDFIGVEYSQIANGDIVEGTKINIREIEIGGVFLKNVEASVVHSLSAPLLLGQSALEKLGKIQVDPKTSTLTIN